MRFAAALFLALVPGALAAQEMITARYVEPTQAYGHGALGGGEYAALEVILSDGRRQRLRYVGAVFEDTAPRLHDFDRDGAPEVVTVLSGFETGAAIQIFGLAEGGLVPRGGTAPIGQRHRWLAIAGIADFDGDGRDEIAYVDRPHLAKILRFVTVALSGAQTEFIPLAVAPGLTNHHLGAAGIEGGVRICPDALPVVVTADAAWQQIVETRFAGGAFESQSVGSYAGAASFAPFLACE